MRTTIDIPDELWERSKTVAVTLRVSLSEVVKRALMDYVWNASIGRTEVSDTLPKVLPRK